MKKFIGLIKANLVVVILVLLVLVLVPLSFVFASSWNAQIRDDQQALAKKDLDAINGLQVSYQDLQLWPGEPSAEQRTAPNKALTEAFQARRAQQVDEMRRVIEMALEYNRRSHEVLLEGIFPEPSPRERQTKAFDFAQLMVPTQDPQNPSAYEKLLRNFGVGGPPQPQQLLVALQDSRDRELQRRQQLSPDGSVSAQDQEEVGTMLRNQRISAYQRRAQGLSMYVELGTLAALYPQAMPLQAPSIAQCFVWQWDYWVVSDILAAMNEANRIGAGSEGMTGSIETAVVKRIETLTIEPLSNLSLAQLAVGPSNSRAGSPAPGVDPLLGEEQYNEREEYMRRQAQSRSRNQPAAAAAAKPGATIALLPGAVKRDFGVSLAGLVGGAEDDENELFDLRRVTLSIIASSERLPVLLDALREVNYMEVVDLDLEQIDPWQHLFDGFYYGQEHVVRANIVIDTIWLREWTRELMPANVREALKVEDPKPTNEEGAG